MVVRAALRGWLSSFSMSLPTSSDDAEWENLISWLKTFDTDFKQNLCVFSRRVSGSGRGLFVTKDVAPNTPLFSVPSAAYLNASTLSKIYRGFDYKPKLSAVQFISLHLYLHRPEAQKNASPFNRVPAIATYDPYLAILPQCFASHPLSWLALNTQPTLLTYMPPAAKLNLQKRLDQFQQDWKSVSTNIDYLLQKSLDFVPLSFISWRVTANKEAELERYLWAWLTVNTRSFYMQLNPSKSDPDNITLCPLADLANHSSCEWETTSKPPFPTFYSPSGSSLRENDEIYLRYGSHSNLTLFTEYGFAEEGTPNGGQVDVQDIIEAWFSALGDLGRWMRLLLENVNFWGDWFLYDLPSPPSPSYRILPALRLLQLSDSLSSDIIISQDPFALSEDLNAWRDTISGEKEIISDSNENAVWHYITLLCDLVSIRAHAGLEGLSGIIIESTVSEWYSYAVKCIRQLWLEELRVAEAIIRSIKAGEIP